LVGPTGDHKIENNEMPIKLLTARGRRRKAHAMVVVLHFQGQLHAVKLQRDTLKKLAFTRAGFVYFFLPDKICWPDDVTSIDLYNLLTSIHPPVVHLCRDLICPMAGNALICSRDLQHSQAYGTVDAGDKVDFVRLLDPIERCPTCRAILQFSVWVVTVMRASGGWITGIASCGPCRGIRRTVRCPCPCLCARRRRREQIEVIAPGDHPDSGTEAAPEDP